MHSKLSLADCSGDAVQGNRSEELLESTVNSISVEELDHIEADSGAHVSAIVPEKLARTTVLKLACIWLRIGNYYHVPSIAVDVLLHELHFLLGYASQPIDRHIH